MFKGFIKKSIPEKVEWIRFFLNVIVNNPEISADFSNYGVNEEQLNKGFELTDKLLKDYNKCEEMKALKSSNYAFLMSTYEKIKKDYYEKIELSKLALKDYPILAVKLFLYSKKQTKLIKVMEKAKLFSELILNDEELLSILNKKNITKEKIQKLYDLTKNNYKFLITYTISKNSYHASVYTRDLSEKQTVSYISDFVKIAYIIYKNKKDMIKKLGLKPKKITGVSNE